MSPDYGKKGAPHFITRTPQYRSEIANEMLQEIDAQEEPPADAGNKYVSRVRAEEKDKDACLPRGMVNGEDLRVEMWMVDAEWLKKHKKCCDNPNKIRDNPPGWGNEDPEEVDARYAAMRAEKEVINAAARKRKAATSVGVGRASGSGSGRGRKASKGNNRATVSTSRNVQARDDDSEEDIDER